MYEIVPIGKYKNKQKGILWLLQLVSLCLIVIWLINPVSSQIYMLAIYVTVWFAATIINYGAVFLRMYQKSPMITMFAWLLILFLYSLANHSEFSLSFIMYLICFGIGSFYLQVRDKKTSIVVFIVVTYFSPLTASLL